MKKTGFFVALLLLLILPFSLSVAGYTAFDVTFSVSDGYYVFTRDSMRQDTPNIGILLAASGVTLDHVIADWQEQSIAAEIIAPSFHYQIDLTINETEESQTIWDYRYFDSSVLATYVAELKAENGYADSKTESAENATFVVNSFAQTAAGQTITCQQYDTIVGGVRYTFTLTIFSAATETEIATASALLSSVAESAAFPEKEQPLSLSVGWIVFFVALGILLVALVWLLVAFYQQRKKAPPHEKRSRGVHDPFSSDVQYLDEDSKK